MVLFAKIFFQKNSIVDTQPGSKYYCVKSVFIWSYSGPYFPACGLNMERYEISLRIQSKCVELRTRITINTNTFHAVYTFYASTLIKFRVLNSLCFFSMEPYLAP